MADMLEEVLSLLTTRHTLAEWEWLADKPNHAFSGLELLIFSAAQSLRRRQLTDWIDLLEPKAGVHPQTGQEVNDSDPITTEQAILYMLMMQQGHLHRIEHSSEQSLGKLQKQDLFLAATNITYPRTLEQFQELAAFVRGDIPGLSYAPMVPRATQHELTSGEGDESGS